jgi:hypothetical protein
MERRGRPPREKSPKDGCAWVRVSVLFNGQVSTRTLEVRDYAGSVPGPQRSAQALSDRVSEKVTEMLGAVRDVP